MVWVGLIIAAILWGITDATDVCSPSQIVYTEFGVVRLGLNQTIVTSNHTFVTAYLNDGSDLIGIAVLNRTAVTQVITYTSSILSFAATDTFIVGLTPEHSLVTFTPSFGGPWGLKETIPSSSLDPWLPTPPVAMNDAGVLVQGFVTTQVNKVALYTFSRGSDDTLTWTTEGFATPSPNVPLITTVLMSSTDSVNCGGATYAAYSYIHPSSGNIVYTIGSWAPDTGFHGENGFTLILPTHGSTDTSAAMTCTRGQPQLVIGRKNGDGVTVVTRGSTPLWTTVSTLDIQTDQGCGYSVSVSNATLLIGCTGGGYVSRWMPLSDYDWQMSSNYTANCSMPHDSGVGYGASVSTASGVSAIAIAAPLTANGEGVVYRYEDAVPITVVSSTAASSSAMASSTAVSSSAVVSSTAMSSSAMVSSTVASSSAASSSAGVSSTGGGGSSSGSVSSTGGGGATGSSSGIRSSTGGGNSSTGGGGKSSSSGASSSSTGPVSNTTNSSSGRGSSTGGGLTYSSTGGHNHNAASGNTAFASTTFACCIAFITHLMIYCD
jgi:hypothetical protein